MVPYDHVQDEADRIEGKIDMWVKQHPDRLEEALEKKRAHCRAYSRRKKTALTDLELAEIAQRRKARRNLYKAMKRANQSEAFVKNPNFRVKEKK